MRKIKSQKQAKPQAGDLINYLLRQAKTKEARQKKEVLASFFKTKKGDYAEGDIFLGITVPQLRDVTKNYLHLSLLEIKKLLISSLHEVRFAALIILIKQYEEAANNLERKKIVDFYLANAKRVNNWDLVDLSAHKILGDFLLDKKESEVDAVLFKLATSKNLWERRIAIVSTWAFIKAGRKRETFIIVEKLLNDQEDLIHKACGWMLREVGKIVSEKDLEIFLKKHIKSLPRVTLRYALEKFAENKKIYYYSLGK